MRKTETNNQAGQTLASRMWRRARNLLGVVGMGLSVSTAPVAAKEPVAVPQHWISYAQMAGNQFEAWLSDGNDEQVVRLHTWMQERLLKEGQDIPPPLVVSVWLTPDGHVSQLKFASLGQEQADRDLKAVLTAQALSEPPPRDMLQPMVLQLSLSFDVPK
jgi:hypothetical protein